MTAQRDGPEYVQPIPDALVEGPRESFALTFVGGLQRLPPCQRAALVLHDVLGFERDEVAEMMETSEAAVDEALELGRAAFDPGPGHMPEREAEVACAFHHALERGDPDGLARLLADDVVLTVPPGPLAYEGKPAVAAFLLARPARLVPTRANGQPAFACYTRIPPASVAYARGMLVLTLRADLISAITCFRDTSFFGFFGLPRELREGLNGRLP